MSAVGQIEKKTQQRVVKLFRDALRYDYLGDWTDRDGNANVEPELLRAWLKKQSVDEALITRALYALDKKCPTCDATLTSRDIFPETLVAETMHGPYQTPYIDGGALTRRYENPVRRYIRTDLENLLPPLKAATLFRGPKILIRQAGVGIAATLVGDDARCPQSLYIYRTLPAFEVVGYSNEFILACLVSRTMNYICMKKFAEIDPAKAFAKLTHARIAQFPIPKLEQPSDISEAAQIQTLVRRMLTGAEHGGQVDFEIEFRLRRLWGISGDEGRFINGFFSILPDGQAVADLFPRGAPPRIPFPLDIGQNNLPLS